MLLLILRDFNRRLTISTLILLLLGYDDAAGWDRSPARLEEVQEEAHLLIRHIFTAALALCATSMAVRGFAQQPSDVKAVEERFKQLDKNGDGRITKDEVPDSPFFKQRDVNGDGVITLAELKATLAGAVAASTTAAPDKKPTASPPAPAKKTAKPSDTSLRRGPQPLKASDH